MRVLGLLIAIILGLFATAMLVAYLAGWEVDTGWGDMRGPQLVQSATIAALIGSGVLLGSRQSLSRTLGMLVIWAGVFLLVVLGYSYRHEITPLWSRIRAELFAGEVISTGPGQIQVTRSGDSHFYIEAEVNGGSVLFMVDTGASMIALSWDDARAAGLDPERLKFTRRVSTASGIAMVAPVRVETLSIGPIRRRNISAVVLPEGVGASLLGLAFLDTLKSYEISGDRLTMRN